MAKARGVQGQASARERLFALQADRQAIQNKKLRGELVETSQVRRDHFSIARVLRDTFLGIGSRIAAELAAETDRGVIERRLEDEHRAVLAAVIAELEKEAK